MNAGKNPVRTRRRHRLVYALARSPTLRTGAIYGAAGLAFAGANLVLAGALPVEQYGLFALAVAVLNFSIPVAPLGMDGMVNRHRIAPGRWLLRRAAGTSALVASAGLAAVAAYDLPPLFTVLTPIAILWGGINYVAAAHLQSRQRFLASLSLVQGANLVMLMAAIGVLVLEVQRAVVPFAVLTAYYLVAGVVGWVFVRSHREPDSAVPPITWGESLAYVGVSAAVVLLGQLERLLIPALLGLAQLATFGVLAATAGSVFRILLLGVGYSLLPNLRAAADTAERRRLVWKEARATLAILAAATPAIWWGAPWLVDAVLGGRYTLPPGLVLAAMVTGFIRVGGAFARTIVSALAEPVRLGRLNLLGWLSAAVAATGAIFGASWGLPGVIYGVGAGWLVQASSAAWLAIPLLSRGGEGRSSRVVYPH